MVWSLFGLILYLFYQLVGKCHLWTWLSTFMDLIINIHGSVETRLGIMYFGWASSNNHQEGPRTAISAKMIQASWNKSFITACFDLWFACLSLPERRLGLTSGICKPLLARCWPGPRGLLMAGDRRREFMK